MVSRSEKNDVLLLKAHGFGSESEILRNLGFPKIREKAAEIRERVGDLRERVGDLLPTGT